MWRSKVSKHWTNHQLFLLLPVVILIAQNMPIPVTVSGGPDVSSPSGLQLQYAVCDVLCVLTLYSRTFHSRLNHLLPVERLPSLDHCWQMMVLGRWDLSSNTEHGSVLQIQIQILGHWALQWIVYLCTSVLVVRYWSVVPMRWRLLHCDDWLKTINRGCCQSLSIVGKRRAAENRFVIWFVWQHSFLQTGSLSLLSLVCLRLSFYFF